MNYIFYIIIAVSFLCLAIVPPVFKRKLQRDFFGKMSVRNILAQNPTFFSSGILADLINQAIRRQRQDVLKALADGKLNTLIRLTAPWNPLISAVLSGFNKPQTGVLRLRKLLKNNRSRNHILIWLALMSAAAGKQAESSAAWDNVAEKGLTPYLKAQYKIHLADAALRSGDLEFASQNLYRAAFLFNRRKAFYEEACVYLKLGTIYRICFIEDTAETLFRSALKIFELLQYEKGIAQTLANLGMLMSGQERFEEAAAYFAKAQEHCSLQNFPIETAYIQNQTALLHILQKNYKTARKILNRALKIHAANNNINGEAFSAELSADSYWGECHFKAAARAAAKAAGLYLKGENISGLLESLYLQAQALFRQNNDAAAEKILRKIINIGKKDCGCFYLANAYNLLGIIYVKRKDMRRAKGLFRQSLDLEQRGARTLALAADYTNIGLVDIYCGRADDAEKNLRAALELAKDAGDEELCRQIQQHLKRISN